MARIKKVRAPVKVNEGNVCAYFARMAKCPTAARWDEQQHAFTSCMPTSDFFPWDISSVHLLPIAVDVQSVMWQSKTAKMDPDLLVALLSDPDTVFVVQDVTTVGIGSLWFVVMESDDTSDSEAAYLLGWPVRMVVNTFAANGTDWRVIAVQAQTAFNIPNCANE